MSLYENSDFVRSLLSPDSPVQLKQEVAPPDYLSEEDEEDQNRNRDPDYNRGLGSAEDGSDSDSTDGEIEIRPGAAPSKSNGRTSRGLAKSKASPRSRPAVSKNVVDGGDESDDDTDGEIKDPSTVPKMTRVLYPADLSLDEVMRSTRSIIRLQRLPESVASKGTGPLLISKGEMESITKSSQSERKEPQNKVSREQPPAERKPGPKSKTFPRIQSIQPSVSASAKQLTSRDPKYDPRTCPRCGKTFTRPSGLEYHMTHVHIDNQEAYQKEQASRKFVCETCGQRFIKPSHLTKHKQKHNRPPAPASLYQCRFRGCAREFNKTALRNAHEVQCAAAPPESRQLPDSVPLTTIAPEDPDPAIGPDGNSIYNVVIDGDSIRLKRRENIPRRVPAAPLSQPGRNLKVCRFCKKAFKSTTTCRLHEFRHSGQKQYKCGYEGCGAEFAMEISLTEHVRMVHTGEKPYKCEYEGCGEAFARVLTFKHHIRSKHLKTKFQCPTCGQVFTMKSTLARHELLHTGAKRHLCPQCGKGFRAGYNLRLHSKVHLKPPRNKYPRDPNNPTKRDWRTINMNRKLREQMGIVTHQDLTYRCTYPGCNSAYARESNLNQHLATRHGIGIQNVASDQKKEKGKRKQAQPQAAAAASISHETSPTSTAYSSPGGPQYPFYNNILPAPVHQRQMSNSSGGFQGSSWWEHGSGGGGHSLT